MALLATRASRNAVEWTDRELLKCVLRNDARGWAELVRRYRPLIFRGITKVTLKYAPTLSSADLDEIYGIGGSWFRLNSDLKIEWQRDFFDFGHVSKMFMKLIESGDLSAGMQKRIERSMAGEQLPGYYPLGEAPSKIW